MVFWVIASICGGLSISGMLVYKGLDVYEQLTINRQGNKEIILQLFIGIAFIFY